MKLSSVLFLSLSLAILPAAQSANLIGAWSFDGNLDDGAAEGGANNGTAIGSPAFNDNASPAGGQSLLLNGEDQGVGILGAAALDSNESSLTYWVNPLDATQSGGFERLTSRGGDTFETAISSTNNLSYFSPGPGWITIADTTVAPNEWTHVAWVSAGTGAEDMTLYVNGTSVFTGPGISDGNPTGLLNLGIRHNNVEGYEGLLDDVRLFSGALTAGEVGSLAVPEPSGALFLLLGATAFAARRRR